MILFNKKETSKKEIKEIVVDKKLKKELAFLVFKAKGRSDIEQFAKNMKLFDHTPIENLLKGNYSVLPDRKLLRRISDYSEGRINYKLLYDCCGYSESDPEEDRSWMKWTPKRGEVYIFDLGFKEDHIQGGNQRPGIIIQNNKGNQHSPNLVIIPTSKVCKFNPQLHVLLEKTLGFRETSYALVEQISVISKRRGFFNGGIPFKITTLPDQKMKLIQHALEFELGFEPLYFDEEHAFKLIESIKHLENNIINKKANNLKDILQQKFNELINYCNKYKKDYKYVIQEYNRINNYTYQVI